jgi:benzaldehyde dehydrogenase (NAD)
LSYQLDLYRLTLADKEGQEMSTEVTDRATDNALLGDEGTWTGRVFSDGWVDAPETIESSEPATGDVLATAGVGNADTVAKAAASAARAQREWAATPISDRIQVIRKAAELMEQHRAELIRWMVREGGAIPPKADNEVSASIGQFEMAASLISHPLGQVLPSLTPGRSSMARRVPVGVVGVICPWNFPLVLPARSVGPALALGNAVVLKSDLNTPVSGGVLTARIFEEAGLPEGVLHVIGGGAEVGQAIVEDPNIRMISFTGSTATGRKVGEAAGRNLKRMVLEMGGNSPLVVLDDADIEMATSAGAWGSFAHQGQICLAVSRHLVHESIAADYVKALAERASHLPVGNPHTDQVALGPIINEKQVERVDRIVGDSVDQGAELVTGGKHEGLFYEATVLADVTASMPAFTDEIFGPVAPVTTFKDDDDAVELANATDYGLVAAVQSGSQRRAAAVAERLHAGMVHNNDSTVNEEPPAPFGGFGQSSNGGHFGGVANLELWTEWQWVTSRDKAEPFPF